VRWRKRPSQSSLVAYSLAQIHVILKPLFHWPSEKHPNALATRSLDICSIHDPKSVQFTGELRLPAEKGYNRRVTRLVFSVPRNDQDRRLDIKLPPPATPISATTCPRELADLKSVIPGLNLLSV